VSESSHGSVGESRVACDVSKGTGIGLVDALESIVGKRDGRGSIEIVPEPDYDSPIEGGRVSHVCREQDGRVADEDIFGRAVAHEGDAKRGMDRGIEDSLLRGGLVGSGTATEGGSERFVVGSRVGPMASSAGQGMESVGHGEQ
jgi:hypothetical protein